MDVSEAPVIRTVASAERCEFEDAIHSSENSDTGSDVARLLRSTRILIHSCSQESFMSADRARRGLPGIMCGLHLDHGLDHTKGHSWPDLSCSLNYTKRSSEDLRSGREPQYHFSFLHSNKAHSVTTSSGIIPQTVPFASTASEGTSPIWGQVLSTIPTSASLRSLRADKMGPAISLEPPYPPEGDSLCPPARQVCHGSAERSSTTGLPDFVSLSPKTSEQGVVSPGHGKKGKIAIPFLRPKPTNSLQCKSIQLKEIKRMIRSGKPSFEQIHSWRQSFETLLNDRFGIALFKDFLSTEFSDENIEFWIACQEYKQINNPKKLAARAQRIFDEFIAVHAEREVNLDSRTRLQTEADVAHPTIHTYDNAQKRIQALMEKDSYRRFLRSEVYITLYAEAREVAKAAASSALAASLQDASSELDGALLNLVTSSTSNTAFSFLSNLGSTFVGTSGPGLNLPGVAAAAARADAGMNSVQDLQLLGLSTSRHMRKSKAQADATQEMTQKARTGQGEFDVSVTNH